MELFEVRSDLVAYFRQISLSVLVVWGKYDFRQSAVPLMLMEPVESLLLAGYTMVDYLIKIVPCLPSVIDGRNLIFTVAILQSGFNVII